MDSVRFGSVHVSSCIRTRPDVRGESRQKGGAKGPGGGAIEPLLLVARHQAVPIGVVDGLARQMGKLWFPRKPQHALQFPRGDQSGSGGECGGDGVDIEIVIDIEIVSAVVVCSRRCRFRLDDLERRERRLAALVLEQMRCNPQVLAQPPEWQVGIGSQKETIVAVDGRRQPARQIVSLVWMVGRIGPPVVPENSCELFQRQPFLFGIAIGIAIAIVVIVGIVLFAPRFGIRRPVRPRQSHSGAAVASNQRLLDPNLQDVEGVAGTPPEKGALEGLRVIVPSIELGEPPRLERREGRNNVCGQCYGC